MRKMFAVCKKKMLLCKIYNTLFVKKQIVELKTVDIIRCLIRI